MPEISIVIPTRNRGASIVKTIESVLCNDYANFEMRIIDQSTDRQTERAVEPFQRDGRVSYRRSNETGVARAHTTWECSLPRANW